MDKTLIAFILDETGSMASRKAETISGFNEWLDTVRQQGKAVRFNLTKFNSAKIATVYEDTPIKDVGYLSEKNYSPSDTTPLYDAVGQTLQSIEGKLGSGADKPDVLVVILTDGLENASRNFDRKKVFDMVKAKQDVGWTFLNLGADQDAWLESEKMGIPQGATVDFANDGYGETMRYGTACAAAVDYLNTSHAERTLSSYTASLTSSLDDGGIAKYQAKIQKRLNKKEVERWQK